MDLENLKPNPEPNLDAWIGRQESASDLILPKPIAALSATLDRDDAPPRTGDPLPPLWHWLYFLPMHRASELGEDGHAKLGGFLPPVPLPSRMWAGSRLQFHHPLRVGEAVTRVSRIVDIQPKQGRTGPLVFVLVKHEISNAAGVAITEEHDIVYRGHVQPGQAPPAPKAQQWERVIRPDDVLLFRYSAVTFNAHRIHFDRRYCTDVESYPGLVVHGPLIATLLLDLLRRQKPDAIVSSFSFRAVSALYDIAPFSVCGQADGTQVHLWARNSANGLAMDATAIIRA